LKFLSLKFSRATAGLALALLMAQPACAGLAANQPDLAFGAYQRGLYQTAFQEAMKRIDADKHDAAAMTLVAALLEQGAGAAQNTAEAMRWYTLAASEGDKNAQFALGLAYLTGKGEEMPPQPPCCFRKRRRRITLAPGSILA